MSDQPLVLTIAINRNTGEPVVINNMTPGDLSELALLTRVVNSVSTNLTDMVLQLSQPQDKKDFSNGKKNIKEESVSKEAMNTSEV
jgi:hypothetical protein